MRDPARWGIGLAVLLVAMIAADGVLREVRRSGEMVVGAAMALPEVMGWGLVAGGIVLIGRGRPRRVGRTLHCSRCAYERAPEQARLVDQCPECGAAWRWYRGTRVGRPTGRGWMLWAGTGLWMLALAGLVGREAGTARLMRVVPDAGLINLLGIMPPYAAEEEWAELKRRKLSAPRQDALAAALLDSRLRFGPLRSDQAAWLLGHVHGGKCPAPLLRRYYDEMVELELVAPDVVSVGETIPMLVRSRNRGNPVVDRKPGVAVYFAGLRAQEALPPGFVGPPASGFILEDDELLAHALRPESPGWSIGEAAHAVGAGSVRVTAVVWLVAGSPAPIRIPWQDDGTPELPRVRVWSRRVEVERVVKIVE